MSLRGLVQAVAISIIVFNKKEGDSHSRPAPSQ